MKISTNALLLVTLGLVTSCSGLFVADAENRNDMSFLQVSFHLTGLQKANSGAT